MFDGTVHGLYKKISDVTDTLLFDIYNAITSLSTRIANLEETLIDNTKELFTKKISSKRIVYWQDGSETCLTKDQIDRMIQNLPANPSVTPKTSPSPTLSISPTPTIEISDPSTASGSIQITRHRRKTY